MDLPSSSPTDGHLLRSLKKSRVRTEVMMYLYNIYPNTSYPYDISRQTGIDSTNVIGALRGMGSRYKNSNSLIGMGLVDKVENDGVTYYKLSDRGKRFIDSMDMTKTHSIQSFNRKL